MNKGLKYGLVGTGVLAVTYLVVALMNKRKGDDDFVQPNPQEKPDPTLTDATINSTAIGMKLFSKVDEVRIRNQNFVNDGLISNVYDTVPLKDTYMGKVVRILVGPKDQINPATKRPYNWLSFQLDKTLYGAMQKNRLFFNRDVVEAIPPPNKTWVREDVVYAKK